MADPVNPPQTDTNSGGGTAASGVTEDTGLQNARLQVEALLAGGRLTSAQIAEIKQLFSNYPGLEAKVSAQGLDSPVDADVATSAPGSSAAPTQNGEDKPPAPQTDQAMPAARDDGAEERQTAMKTVVDEAKSAANLMPGATPASIEAAGERAKENAAFQTTEVIGQQQADLRTQAFQDTMVLPENAKFAALLSGVQVSGQARPDGQNYVTGLFPNEAGASKQVINEIPELTQAMSSGKGML